MKHQLHYLWCALLVTAALPAAAQTQESPLAIEIGETAVPAFSPVYYAFTPTEDGKFDISTSLENSTFKITTIESLWGGLSTQPTEVSLQDLENGKYRFNGTADKKYDIVLTKADGKESETGTMSITAADMSAEPGGTWEKAIETEAGDVTIPASPSVIWYKLEAPEDGVMKITTDMSGGSRFTSNQIVVYIGEVSDGNKTVIDPEAGWSLVFAPTNVPVKKGDIIYVYFNNKENNSSDSTATFTFGQLEPGETASNPIAIDFKAPSMTYLFKTNEYNSATWYSIDIPNNGIFGCYSQDAYFLVSVYTLENPEVEIANGSGDWSGNYGLTDFEIKAGKYLIKIYDLAEDVNATISLETDEEDPGDNHTPITIELGETDVPNYSPVNFTFTPEKDGKYDISTTLENATFKITTTGGGFIPIPSEVDIQKLENGKYRFNGSAYKQYDIVLTKADGKESETGTLTIEMVDPTTEPGGTWEKAIETEAGDVTIPASPAEIWYKLEAPEDGLLIITTTMSGGSFLIQNEIDVYIGEVNDENKTVIAPEPGISSAFSPAKIPVAKGDIIYVYFNNKENNSEDTTATFKFAQPQPGETPADPIAIDFKGGTMSYTFKVSDDSTPVWYSINIPKNGLFSCYSEADYFYLAMYSADDPDQPVAENNSYMYNGLYEYEIEAGKYLLKIADNPEDVTVDIVLEAEEEDPGKDSTQVNVEVENGQIYTYTVANGTQSYFSLNLPEDWSVKSATLNEETIDPADRYEIATEGEIQNYFFIVKYDKEVEFIDQTTGMVAVSNDIKIGVVNGKIRIEGAAEGDQIIVYTMGGMQVAGKTAAGNLDEIELPAGAYVVTVAGSAAKVVL